MAEAKTRTPKKKKLLVIDKDQLLGKILKYKLGNKFGMEISEISRLDEVIPAYKKFRPDIIIVDPIMNDGSATDKLEMVSNLECRIIFLTSLSGKSDKERAKRLGCRHYLNKDEATFSDIMQAIVSEAWQ